MTTGAKTLGAGSLLNGNGPWWVKLIGQIGIGGASLVFLVWFLTQQFSGDLAAHDAANTARLDTLIRVFTAVCVNTAENSEERSRCFSLDGLQR